ncbi:unnamed protein product [Amoebophrya sp. A25]|nr:unnamed protein product [Amoebophrya sp. A25]|eukprot:GSA25T00021064001.1
MRPPFLQHIYRVRHLVEVESKKDQQNPDAFKPRPSLYEGPGQTSFRTRDTDDLGRDVRGVDTYPESSTELFYRMIMGKMPDPLPERSSPSKSLTTRQRPMSQNGRRPIGPMPVQTSTRPKSAPLVNNSPQRDKLRLVRHLHNATNRVRVGDGYASIRSASFRLYRVCECRVVGTLCRLSDPWS